MDAHSSHLTAPLRSRSSQTPSPSHSASASITSSFRKRKFNAPEDHAPPFPSPFSDTRDGALTSTDDLESISARGGADSYDSEEFEGVVDDEAEEYDDTSMRNFTASHLENNFGPVGRNTKVKMDNRVKVEPSELGKDGGPGAAGSTPTAVSGIVVKEETVKSIFTENLKMSGAYCAREESLKNEEEAGKLKFVCVSNDNIDEHMIWLIGLKNIFSRQLPNMPKEYIVRLVVDRGHKSVMVTRCNTVVGGITYRPYVSQKFGEIDFCAIASDERWYGYIKDYDGGILMECKIDLKLPYTDLSTMIHLQRQAIDEKIRELSNCHIVYPGIDLQKKEVGVPKRLFKLEDVPGLREAGWTTDQWGHSRFKVFNSSPDGTPSQKLTAFMRSILKAIHDHDESWPFKEPVDACDVPDYYDIIRDPIGSVFSHVNSQQRMVVH